MIDSNLKIEFDKVDALTLYNSKKVLDAFHKNNVSEIHFNSTSGYGYNDLGRDTIEKVYSDLQEIVKDDEKAKDTYRYLGLRREGK